MDDERVVCWTAFGGEDGRDGGSEKGIGAETVDGLGGERD